MIADSRSSIASAAGLESSLAPSPGLGWFFALLGVTEGRIHQFVPKADRRCGVDRTARVGA